jgi:tight adherence protein B
MDAQLLAISLITFVAVALLSSVLFSAIRLGALEYRRRYVAETGQQLQEMFLLFAPEQMLVLSAMCALLGAFLGFAWNGSWLMGLLAGCAGWYSPRIWLVVAKRRRARKFEEQLLEALSTLSSSMRAGFSLIQALEMVAREMNPPLSQEFGLMLREHRLGVSLDAALQNMTSRMRSKNLDLVVTSILIARSTGGNLAEVFTSIADTMRNIQVIEGKIDALTAQGRLQGIVIGILPLAMGWLMFELDPEMMGILFSDPLGWGILGLIVLFEAIGAFFIWKIVNIDI